MTIKNDRLEVSTKSEGAELTSIKLNGKEYLWNGDEKYWGRHAPILFPIVGKLKDGKTMIENKEYFMSRHGFARDMKFDEVEHTESSVKYLLKSNDNTLKVYPYLFELYISYELIGDRVKVTYEVKNDDNKDIYFSIGAHPAFCCPLDEDIKFEDYYIEFEKNETQNFISQDENGYISKENELIMDNSKVIELDKTIFKKIDTYIFSELNSKVVSLKSKKGEHCISMYFDGFPYFGIWTKPDEAPFICLEPWYGVSDLKNADKNFANKLGIQRLEKGKTFICNYEIEVK